MKSGTDFRIESPSAQPRLWHIARRNGLVLDRELDEEKSHDSSGSRIRCPLCGWSRRKDDLWSCTSGNGSITRPLPRIMIFPVRQ